MSSGHLAERERDGVVGGETHTEREVGILDGILSLVQGSSTLWPGLAAQQLHMLLH